jgi:protease IV
MEGMNQYAQKQLEQAGTDDNVKAVVVRINSPGGTITASDDLHRRIVELRQGNLDKKIQAKHVVVSMGSIAASGGYYIAAPAETIFAERTTVTGSIGVYASFPNVKKLADTYGVRMDIIKQGEVKDSGSPFKDMTAQEQQLWQDMVDHAYAQFLAVVNDGRGKKLKKTLREVLFTREIPDRDPDGNVKKENGAIQMVTYERRLADGGIFTADQAKEYNLVDQIGYLDAAIQEAQRLAGLDANSRIIQYDRPPSLLGGLLGIQAPQPGMQIDPARLADSATPRLWYLAPQSELAGVLATIGR